MADLDYIRLMARYNAWQHVGITMAADSLTGEALLEDRGAFFGSVFRTLNHLLWGDRIWMHRFAGTPAPEMESIGESVGETADWDSYKAARREMDRVILDWAEGLGPEWLDGDLTWWSGAAGREVSKPKSMLVTHFFNHGTHHRGQVHVMLTAAGAVPGASDIFLMPE